jgi:hypothetical protein
MFQRTLGTTRWPGRLVHQDVPEGLCEHLTVFRCSGGHLERPDGPEGWCTKMFLKIGANILLSSDVQWLEYMKPYGASGHTNIPEHLVTPTYRNIWSHQHTGTSRHTNIDQMARKVGAPRCSWRLVRTSYLVQMFRRTLGTTRWPGRLVHQDVPEGWCEHLTVFRCSGGKWNHQVSIHLSTRNNK